MIKNIKKSYEHTIYASYAGAITQAVVNNFTPLLFLTFAATYGLSLEKIHCRDDSRVLHEADKDRSRSLIKKV